MKGINERKGKGRRRERKKEDKIHMRDTLVHILEELVIINVIHIQYLIMKRHKIRVLYKNKNNAHTMLNILTSNVKAIFLIDPSSTVKSGSVSSSKHLTDELCFMSLIEQPFRQIIL